MPGSVLSGQGDLFAGGGWDTPARASTASPVSGPVDPQTLDDRILLEKLPLLGSGECSAYVDEAVRRHLVGAIPALDALCRRFKGFGLSRPVREQIVAMAALAAIAGPEAARTMVKLLTDNVVAAPGLPFALDAAATLGVNVPPGIVHEALYAADPGLRASACRCARFWPSTVPRLIELLDDLLRGVAREAAVVLGLMGRPEAMPFLVRYVREEPSLEIMEALATVGDNECFVALGRVADLWPDLRHLVVRTLAGSDHQLAIRLLRRIDPDHPVISAAGN